MKRTVEQNKRRSEIYKEVKLATGSVVLARQARDRSVKKITNLAPTIKVREDNRTIYYMPIPAMLKRIKLTPKEKLARQEFNRVQRNKKAKSQRKIARDLNYTPKEAQKLSGLGKKRFNDIISGKEKLYSDEEKRIEARSARWANMSGVYKNGKKKRFDPKIVEACELINLEYGYDIDSRFGWAVYYKYYLMGGDIDDIAKAVHQDPFVLHIVNYNAENYFTW